MAIYNEVLTPEVGQIKAMEEIAMAIRASSGILVDIRQELENVVKTLDRTNEEIRGVWRMVKSGSRTED